MNKAFSISASALSALIACLGFSPASASSYVHVAQTATFHQFIDEETLKAEGANRASAWVTQVFVPGRYPGTLKAARIIISLFEYDCEEGKMQIKASHAYSANLSLVPGWGYQPGWDHVVPNSVAASTMEFACNNRKVAGVFRLADPDLRTPTALIEWVNKQPVP